MWADAASDAPRCDGSGAPGRSAEPLLTDGFPDGRALCPVCLRFVPLDPDGRLGVHDTVDPAESDAEAERRREWINRHGG
jgi:hypothetical protein